MLTFAYIFAIISACAILYGLQFHTVVKQRVISGIVSSQARIEYRMALMGAIIFALSSFYLVYLLTSMLAPSIADNVLDLRWLYYLASSATSSVNPFIIIGMSKTVRSKCLGLFCKNYRSDLSTTQHHSTSLRLNIPV